MSTSSWLDQLLAGLDQSTVTVFGDFCLDAYWLVDPNNQQISVETGLPIRSVHRQRYSLGGAGNVVANLRDLGVSRVHAVGVIGADLFGGEMLRLLRERDANLQGIVVPDSPWQTLVYAKPCRDGVEDSRLDFGGVNEASDAVADALIAALDAASAVSSIVVLNQQIPTGISNPKLIARINQVIARHPATRFIVDSREYAGLYKGAILKLNAYEAGRLLGESLEVGQKIPTSRALDFARRLSAGTGKAVFVTRGEHGLIVADGQQVEEVPGIQIIERTDPVGAGDTTVAALSAVLGAGGDALSAARLANIAASITVRKLQTTGTATPAEIRAVGPDPDYIYQSELADDSRRARFIDDTEIELARDLPSDIHIKHAIFDHDGTISTLREGWEKIMEPMMVKAVLGPQLADASPELYQKVIETVKQFIDRTTGIQTLVQMQGLVKLVKQFGFVPESEVLDEHGYKHIYNVELLNMVRRRVRKLEANELQSSDFQIKNAQALLEHLHRKGVKLYLASGTDQADVIAEAQAMGYAHLFEGRIFGAVGDVNVEAKKIVLERIIRENRLSGHEFATFGDGPVELRETCKRGGICVGVCSDETRRFGYNPAKRGRLIRAGASLLVPDFSQLPQLLRVLKLA